MAPLQIAVIYNKDNTFGLQKDAALLAEQLVIAGRRANLLVGKVRLMDPKEPPVAVDICIHLEVPYSCWFPWARVNCMMVNPEWWLSSWNELSSNFDLFLFKNQSALDYAENLKIPSLNLRRSLVVPWFAGRTLQDMNMPVSSSGKKTVKPNTRMKKECVWFLAGSASKREAAEAILPLWRYDWPTLHVYSTKGLSITSALAANVQIHVQDLSQKEHSEIANDMFGHVCFSAAEGFGYTAAEGELLGAFLFLNTIPTYEALYQSEEGVAWVSTPSSRTKESSPMSTYADFSNLDRIENDLSFAVHKFMNCDAESLWTQRMNSVNKRQDDFIQGLMGILTASRDSIAGNPPLPKHMPPLLNAADCPPISVITLSYNRPKFIENAILNLLSTDYPREKIEWVVVDDSDADKSPSDRIIKFAEQFTPGKVTYVPCFQKLTVGRKRNVGCNKASHDILLMMDDDDHYPVSSFRRRVAWLLKGAKRYDAAVCATIAMYDLLKGTSAVNVPPYTLGLAERCSEATLTCTKKFWSERHFEEVDIAEGETFLKGRESRVVEMPPQQIIVALNHKENLSSRRVPGGAGVTTGCFWGFPRELLVFLHGLAGVKVEAA